MSAAAWFCALSGGATAAPFDIVFDVPQTPSESQAAVLAAAEDFWEGLILGYPDGTPIDALTIAVDVIDMDGEGGALAEGGWRDAVESDGFLIPTFGFVEFDQADLAGLEEEGDLLDTLVHEVAHVMGFGTTWVDNGVYVDGTGEYLGPNALAVYRWEFDPDARFVPVQLGEGSGIDDGHWAEDWAGGPSELMTAFADPDEFVSATTVASFRDIGYRTVPLPAPVPLPAGLWLGLGALALLGIAGRPAAG